MASCTAAFESRPSQPAPTIAHAMPKSASDAHCEEPPSVAHARATLLTPSPTVATTVTAAPSAVLQAQPVHAQLVRAEAAPAPCGGTAHQTAAAHARAHAITHAITHASTHAENHANTHIGSHVVAAALPHAQEGCLTTCASSPLMRVEPTIVHGDCVEVRAPSTGRHVLSALRTSHREAAGHRHLSLPCARECASTNMGVLHTVMLLSRESAVGAHAVEDARDYEGAPQRTKGGSVFMASYAMT
eukprot:1619968-Pleurochrysis_carterae.AAC.1